MKFIDQMGREVFLDKIPERIISLVPSKTELLVDMGLEDKIVGVTKFCVHPQNIRKEKAIVGGPKGIRMEKIRALQPDLILGNKEENTQEMVAEMEKEFPVHLSDINTIEDTYSLIEQYGQMFGLERKASQINHAIKREILKFQEYIADKPQLKVIYFIWRKPWMVVGNDTFVNHLLEMNKFENAYQHISRYPEVDVENLEPADFILLSSEPFPFGEKHKQELLPLVGDRKIRFVDGEYFSWYGTRLEKAFQYFKELRETELNQ